MKTDSVTLTDKSKSHKKAKYMNVNRQTDQQIDRETDRKNNQQTVRPTMINQNRQCDIDRQKQIP